MPSPVEPPVARFTRARCGCGRGPSLGRGPARVLSFLLIALTVTGCGSWNAIAPPAPPLPPAGPVVQVPPAARQLGWVRVCLESGRKIELRHATCDTDSVRGEALAGQRGERDGDPVAFARAEVRAIERHHLSGKVPAFLLIGAGIARAIAVATRTTERPKILPLARVAPR